MKSQDYSLLEVSFRRLNAGEVVDFDELLHDYDVFVGASIDDCDDVPGTDQRYGRLKGEMFAFAFSLSSEARDFELTILEIDAQNGGWGEVLDGSKEWLLNEARRFLDGGLPPISKEEVDETIAGRPVASPAQNGRFLVLVRSSAWGGYDDREVEHECLARVSLFDLARSLKV